jgi:hypothetical protein
MSEKNADATPATMYTNLIPSRPRLRFLGEAGDGAAGTGDADADQAAKDAAAAAGDQGKDDADKGADATLGDAGKKAIDAMKAERNAARAEAAAAKADADAAKLALANAGKPAEEQALEKAKAEARAEAITAANKRILKSELKALATGKLADPADAHLYIDLAKFTVSDDGEVDSEALSEAIDDLLTRKPHLSAVKQTRFDGDADQGAKGKDSKPTQWTKADLDAAKARGDNEAIVNAQNAGLLKDLLGATT